ncbi:MAG: isoprenylcysteine carboxylmethyltransferase family protein [Syntrophales bacterium]
MANIVIYLSYLFGLGSLILFGIFLFNGSFEIIDLHLTVNQALLFNVGLSLLFFIQHSVMIRQAFRKKLYSLIHEEYYSAFYSIFSGMALFAVVVPWQKVPLTILSAEGTFYWMLRILFFLCIAGFYWGVRSLGSFDPLGIKIIKRRLYNREQKTLSLAARGAYQWVRHPLYFFIIIMIWSFPVLTSDRLLFNIIWTIWIVIGTILEERDLIAEFGYGYREYQKKVPMIIPSKYKLNKFKAFF